jgi:hypothetical protein
LISVHDAPRDARSRIFLCSGIEMGKDEIESALIAATSLGKAARMMALTGNGTTYVCR